MKRFKIFSKKTIIAGSVIFVSFLFILMAFAPALSGAGQTATPATAEKSYIPNPTLNTQATWSTFNSSMSYNEYINSTGNPQYLNVEQGTGNYISINPGDIQSSILQNKTLLNASKATGYFASQGTGQVATETQDGNYIELSVNGTTAGGYEQEKGIPITWSEMPYPANLKYDYITMTGYETGTTDFSFYPVVYNSTQGDSNVKAVSTCIDINGTTEQAGNGSTENNIGNNGFFISFPISEIQDASTSTSKGIQIGLRANTPVETTTNAVAYITGLGITSYPITLGTQQNSTARITGALGEANMNIFKPSVPMTIANGSYTEKITQPISITNETINQNSMTGTYAEEITQQGILSISSTPDVSFTNSYINMNLSGINGNQYIVLNLNGVSYTSEISNMTGNKTINLGTVNPESPNSIIVEVELTAGQWNQISKPPSFFSVRGLEYYWWVGLIAALSAIGLGAAAMTHFGGDEEALKIPKGKFGR